jgi:hypothetical protein
MERIRDIVEFRSELFMPVLPDECQVNPGVYGAELAFWLAGQLARQGVITSYPECEDWGWFIEFNPESGAEFAVHCGNLEGTADQWLISLRRYGRRIFGRDKPSFEDAQPLVEAIRMVIAAVVPAAQLNWLYEAGA